MSGGQDIRLYKEQEEDQGLVVVFLENYKLDFGHVLFEVSLKCLEEGTRKEDSPVTPGKGLCRRHLSTAAKAVVEPYQGSLA